jgi:glycosyltransferase involved in cell wall biosynthesis
MQIMVIHNHYQIRGGEDESYQSEIRVLHEAGHQVVPFTEHNDRVSSIGNVQTAMRTVWSRESYHRLQKIIRVDKPDILHVQNFFPLISPSIYYAGRAEGIPIVQALRNYRLLCPNALFFRNGHVCEDCMGKPFTWPGIVHACYRESREATAAVTAMIFAHRLLGTWTEMVDVYVALTEFARKKFIEGGLPAEKIVVKPNFVHPDPGVGEHRGGYMLFVGRLTSEKGVSTLLKAWEQVAGRGKLLIVGDGPMQSMMLDASQRIPRVEYLGRRSVEDVYALMAEAEALILPSEWYETFGRVAVEAFAKGTPVIAANIGAVAELVEHGRTGLLFTPGNWTDLASKIDWAYMHSREMAEMGREARREYEAKYTAERNYRMLMQIYDSAIANVRGR